MDHFHYRDAELWCEDVPLAAIAVAVGTPVYVYSTATLRRHARVMLEAVLDCGVTEPLVAFAVKANPNGAVLATLAEMGLGADVVSIGEYRQARRAGMSPDRIVFSGVGKTRSEMAEALQGGVLQFNLESVEEARTLSALAQSMGCSAPVGFRVNPDVAAGSHAKIMTGMAANKFGLAAEKILEAYASAASMRGLAVNGLAVHIGSQLTSLDPLETAFSRLGQLLAELRRAGHHIGLVDLGGGLGVSYDPSKPSPPSPDDYAAMVGRVTRGWNARLVFEPGRLIAANAGVLLSSVVRVKPGARRPWVIVDAAMNDLLRPALYDAYHAIHAVRPDGRRMTAAVAGPVCESGDTFAVRRKIDRVHEGDLIVFRSAGAYGAAMSSAYNSRPLTPEVLVDGNRWAIVRKRLQLDELAGFSIPEWLVTRGLPQKTF